MVEILLWAPTAKRAEVHVVGGVRGAVGAAGASNEDATRPIEMSRVDAEHFAIDLPEGTDYLLSIDGGEPRPDPRSRFAPDGVHGPSRAVALDFEWSDQNWPGINPLGKVLYEVHVGTFTPGGTLDSAIERLPYLVDLGVDVVELMPLVPFPGRRGWGYDGVSLFAVHEAYGGPDALHRFVDAAHNLRLGVCLDVVYNHFGPAGNYAPVFAPYFTSRHHTPWGDAINLDDEHADGVRRFICDNAIQWLRDYHVDCLRLDAVHALHDDSPRQLLAQLADEVAEMAAQLGRPAALIAESDLNDVAMITPTPDGLGMDGQWADDVHHALHTWLTGERQGYYCDFGSSETLAKAFTGVFVHDGGYSTFRERDWGAPVPDEVDRRRFVTFTQNHDQVGNRALGDRPDASLPPALVAGGVALLLLSPFTPMLFQGQEWGTKRPFQFFTDHDAELGAMVTKGRREEFAEHGWSAGVEVPDPQDPATFAASVLDWSELDEDEHATMLRWHKALIELRRKHLTKKHPVHVEYGDEWFKLVHGPATVAVVRESDYTRASCTVQIEGEPPMHWEG